MLQVLLAPLSYNAGVVSRSSVAGQRSAAPQMVKSESLPFMEEPAHLSGMVGNVGFDPMGLSTPQNIKWMREAELKHGRVCMLAVVGYIVVDKGLRVRRPCAVCGLGRGLRSQLRCRPLSPPPLTPNTFAGFFFAASPSPPCTLPHTPRPERPTPPRLLSWARGRVPGGDAPHQTWA